ncbi:acyltransferase family protein [soil metagenome]
MNKERVAWIDYAKGFCIVMVVAMHSTLGVEKAAGEVGWMHHLIDFATPFRMPDFFMVAGLFLSRTIDRDWRDYTDRKVVHFAYFYLVWLTIQFAFKAPELADGMGVPGLAGAYLLALVEPFGTMWFIYLLPIFFVTVKAARQLLVPPWLVWAAGAALEIASIHTGSTVIDEFAARFVYFYSGYLLAPQIFRLADWAIANVRGATGLLALWAAINLAAVASGASTLPVVSLMLGIAGAIAVVTFAALLSRTNFAAPLRYCGRRSIVIYLAFFLPMAIARVALLKAGWITDLGTISALVTLAGVALPLLLERIVRDTPARILFERPAWARLSDQRHRLAPAE